MSPRCQAHCLFRCSILFPFFLISGPEAQPDDLKQQQFNQIFFFFSYFLARQQVGSQLPNQGLNPCPWQWKQGVLRTRLPGKSLDLNLVVFTFLMGVQVSAQFSFSSCGFLEPISLPEANRGVQHHGQRKRFWSGYHGVHWLADPLAPSCQLRARRLTVNCTVDLESCGSGSQQWETFASQFVFLSSSSGQGFLQKKFPVFERNCSACRCGLLEWER